MPLPDAALPGLVPLERASGPTLYVGHSEVTLSQWDVCVTAGACAVIARAAWAEPDHPVTGVSWLDVQVYLRWLSGRTGKAYRLPTRDEWLWIAADHAPVSRPKLFDDPRLAWAADYDLTARPRSSRTRPSGTFGVNQRGLSDLRGNVWEWTSTCWSDSAGASEDCRGVRIALGEHEAILSELTRDPGKAGCGAGIPPAAIGFRVVVSDRSL